MDISGYSRPYKASKDVFSKKYNKAFDERREKIRAFKGSLTINNGTKAIGRYNRMCFDACQDFKDLAKRLKRGKVGWFSKDSY